MSGRTKPHSLGIAAGNPREIGAARCRRCSPSRPGHEGNRGLAREPVSERYGLAYIKAMNAPDGVGHCPRPNQRNSRYRSPVGVTAMHAQEN